MSAKQRELARCQSTSGLETYISSSLPVPTRSHTLSCLQAFKTSCSPLKANIFCQCLGWQSWELLLSKPKANCSKGLARGELHIHEIWAKSAQWIQPQLHEAQRWLTKCIMQVRVAASPMQQPVSFFSGRLIQPGSCELPALTTLKKDCLSQSMQSTRLNLMASTLASPSYRHTLQFQERQEFKIIKVKVKVRLAELPVSNTPATSS